MQPSEMSREQLEGAVMALERRPYSVESTDYLLNEYRRKLAAMPPAPDLRAALVEVLETALVESRAALEGALRLDPTCDHSDTHREGSIWTVCDQCNRRWADDEGGLKADKQNEYIARVFTALARIDKVLEAQNGSN